MDYSAVSDQNLVSDYIKGDENALKILLERHKSRIFSYIMMTIKDRDLAEDFFQDTFVKVIQTLKRKKYNEEGKFLPWVLRIAHNLMIDHFRKTNKMRMIRPNEEFDIFDTIAGDHLNSDEEIAVNQRKTDIKKLIEMLPEEQKEVIKLRLYYDMSFKEIGAYSNVSINTALGRMRYALINLRKLINEKQISSLQLD